MLLVYVTCADKKEAEKIGKTLVEEGIVACANVLSKSESYYFWKGKFTKETEQILLLKTTEKRFPELEEKIKAIHSYENPAIIALKPWHASKKFTQWVEESIK